MAHSHAHHDHHHVHIRNKKVLAVSLFIITFFMIVEVIGGMVTHSLALLSDAGHMLSDSLAIGLSLLALKFSEKRGTPKYTFGYQRIEILFALLNGLALVGIAVWIIIEAISRFQQPPEIASVGMLLVSVIGLVVNLVIAYYMNRNADVEENINLKSAYLHVLGDLLGSIAAIVSALLILFFDWQLADPIVSMLVSLLIVYSGVGIIRKTFHILMQGSPENLDQTALVAQIKAIDGVLNIHDLHIWTLTSGQHLLSIHLVASPQTSLRQTQIMICEVKNIAQQHHISHTTVQIETEQNEHCGQLCCGMPKVNET